VQSDPIGLHGRLKTDPMDFLPGASSLYEYVRANPLGLLDPFGLQEEEANDTSEWEDDVPPSGGDAKADKACRAAASAAKYESQADEARRRGDWERYNFKMKRAWGYWQKYYEAQGTPVRDKMPEGPVPPPRSANPAEPKDAKE
jgi:hypothetical protein